ncbi:hypothetical protein BSD967_06125 [Bifidobacterium saguini]|uniref:Uncharacterized protein n=1 Tax=Bifidobacterium saguini TaxID=762210 RepID=A0ABX7SB12_9BIFI|nr:hypothetical protein [Bifidobacterium saguini]QTB89952.1 hypothetical protein BSD967_06125 [Bifidobacterium saguini]
MDNFDAFSPVARRVEPEYHRGESILETDFDVFSGACGKSDENGLSNGFS